MTDKDQGVNKHNAPNTKDVISIKRPEKTKAPMTPQNLFQDKGIPKKGEKPSRSDPGEEKHISVKDTRNRVFTPQENKC